MLFYLFCMFDDYGGINHRSPESAGKCVVKTPYLRRPFSDKNHRQVPIIQMTGGAKRGTQVVHVGPTPPSGADGPPGARAGGVVALAHRGQPPFAYFYPP